MLWRISAAMTLAAGLMAGSDPLRLGNFVSELSLRTAAGSKVEPVEDALRLWGATAGKAGPLAVGANRVAARLSNSGWASPGQPGGPEGVESRRPQPKAEWPKNIQAVLANTRPLHYGRGSRLPLYLWPAIGAGKLSDARAEELVRLLDERGVGLIVNWSHGNAEASLEEALTVARAQRRAGLRINVHATSLLTSFFDGSPETAHLDAQGQPFFDSTFGKVKMGCPFRLEHRIPVIRERVNRFAGAYAKAGLPVGFIFTDWEIDGPLEWNHAQESSKRCTVCRRNLPRVDDFLAYQQEMRRLRSRLQRLAYAEPVLRLHPGALVGNYAMYPHNGWRYWYDYFEKYVEGQPALHDQQARYRHWANDFEDSGYTFAMPVVYPWSWTWNWYDFEPGDYRWFYNGLLVASNAGRHTPAGVPIIPFVHYHTVDVGLSEREGQPPAGAQPARQMSESTYQELLWHMLLRGADTFFLWCTEKEYEKEIRLLHPVWAAAQAYAEFLEKGVPITFDVPARPGPVISGLRLGRRVLVRRTDFTSSAGPASIQVNGQALAVPSSPGQCQILTLDAN